MLCVLFHAGDAGYVTTAQKFSVHNYTDLSVRTFLPLSAREHASHTDSTTVVQYNNSTTVLIVLNSSIDSTQNSII